jgi:hypothetical protein
VRLDESAETIGGGHDEGTLTAECGISVVRLADGCDYIAPETAAEVLVLLAETLLKFGGRHGESVRNNETI